MPELQGGGKEAPVLVPRHSLTGTGESADDFDPNGLLSSAHTPRPCVVWVLPAKRPAPRKVPDAAGDGSRCQACREINIAPIVCRGS